VASTEQTRFAVGLVVGKAAVLSYWLAVHVASAVHSRSSVPLGAALSNVPAGQADSQGVHTGAVSSTSVAPDDMNCSMAHGCQYSVRRRRAKRFAVQVHEVSVWTMSCVVASHAHTLHVRGVVATPSADRAGARASYSVAVHATRSSHCQLLVSVGATVRYCESKQSVMVAQP
jgi:hypothetical protein